MIELIANEEIEKAKYVKSPDETVKAVNNMEKKLLKVTNETWIAYQQGQIFEKFKVNENFIDMVK